jgi:hypothetical protein
MGRLQGKRSTGRRKKERIPGGALEALRSATAAQ